MLTQAIYLITFFITVGLITGVMSILGALVTITFSSIPLLMKWLEIIKRRDKKDRKLLEKIVADL